MDDKFNLLEDKSIIAILDGDTILGSHTLSDGSSIELRMPYLSGPELRNLSEKFGLTVNYPEWGGGALSRWKYFFNLIDHCVAHGSCSQLLAYIFRKEAFAKLLIGKSSADINNCYRATINRALDVINGILFFSNNELTWVNNSFIIRPTEEIIAVEAPTLKNIERDYVKSIFSRAIMDIQNDNLDSAITKSRTLLEEVFCYAIEKKDEKPDCSGNIQKLYKQVRTLYNMHTDANMDKRVNTILSGLSSIVNAIAEMRNKNSDSHGVGSNRIKIDRYHALLFVNASIIVADFILSVQSKQSPRS